MPQCATARNAIICVSCRLALSNTLHSPHLCLTNIWAPILADRQAFASKKENTKNEWRNSCILHELTQNYSFSWQGKKRCQLVCRWRDAEQLPTSVANWANPWTKWRCIFQQEMRSDISRGTRAHTRLDSSSPGAAHIRVFKTLFTPAHCWPWTETKVALKLPEQLLVERTFGCWPARQLNYGIARSHHCMHFYLCQELRQIFDRAP